MFYGRTLFTHPINTSLHLLIPASHSSRLLPTSHLAATSPFFMSLILFHRKVRLGHILGSTYKWYHRLFVFLFLTYSVYCDDMVMFGVRAFGRWLGLDLVHSLCLSLSPSSILPSFLTSASQGQKEKPAITSQEEGFCCNPALLPVWSQTPATGSVRK